LPRKPFPCQENQSIAYVHSCLAFVIFIILTLNIPSGKLVVLLSNQAWASRLAHAWFDRRFKNHWLRIQNWSEW